MPIKLLHKTKSRARFSYEGSVDPLLLRVAIDSLSSTMITLILATGTIRNYQIIVGGCLILNFPLSFFLLRNGVTPASVYWVSIAISVLCLNLRMLMLRKTLEFPVMRYVKEPRLRVVFWPKDTPLVCVEILEPDTSNP